MNEPNRHAGFTEKADALALQQAVALARGYRERKSRALREEHDRRAPRRMAYLASYRPCDLSEVIKEARANEDFGRAEALRGYETQATALRRDLGIWS